MRRTWDDDDWTEDGPVATHDAWFEELYTDALITDVVMPMKSGKEASVHLCRAGVEAGGAGGLVAVKAYHPRQRRGFRNDAVYKNGRVILKARDRRAVAKKTTFGREFDDAAWVWREWEHLRTAHRAGADVPRPIAIRGHAIVMEYVGDMDAPAPQLKDVDAPSPADSERWLDRILWNVEAFLRHHLVHADLSPYNLLVWKGRIRVIDLPQAVDARTNRNARDLLARDVEGVCRHFARWGVEVDPARRSADLWRRYVAARL